MALGLVPGPAPASDAGAEQRRGGRANIPAEATEGPRDIPALDLELSRLVRAQPFGKPWAEIVKTEPPPRDRRGLAEAETHRSLSRDKMEIQEQAQFLDDTGVSVRFGFVSIQVLRVYRYGRLTSLQLVLERAGRGPDSEKRFPEDLMALAKGWGELVKRWGLDKTHQTTRNDLEKARAAGGAPSSAPLRIELEPRSEPR